MGTGGKTDVQPFVNPSAEPNALTTIPLKDTSRFIHHVWTGLLSYQTFYQMNSGLKKVILAGSHAVFRTCTQNGLKTYNNEIPANGCLIRDESN